MIKKIISIAIIGATFVMAGCATNVPMSDSEKALIKSGELVKFTAYYNDTANKMVSGNKVFVCVVAPRTPTEATPCYPKLSAYMGQYFSDAGIKMASSQEQADKVIYATILYSYVGASGINDGYRAMFDDTIESSLQKGAVPELSQETMEEIFNKNAAVKKNMAEQSALETAGKVAIGLVSMAMGGVNGGLYASQAITGLTNPAAIDAPHGTAGLKQMLIVLHEKGLKNDVASGPAISFYGTYDGPIDLFQAFDKLFPSAVKSTAELFAQNVSAK